MSLPQTVNLLTFSLRTPSPLPLLRPLLYGQCDRISMLSHSISLSTSFTIATTAESFFYFLMRTRSLFFLRRTIHCLNYSQMNHLHRHHRLPALLYFYVIYHTVCVYSEPYEFISNEELPSLQKRGFKLSHNYLKGVRIYY